MKWFNFFKGKTGKINIGALALSGAIVGGGLIYGAYQKDVAQEEAMRTSLAGTTTAEDYGMARDSKGRLTAMNIGGGHRLDFSADSDGGFSANEGAAGRLSANFQGGDYSSGSGAQLVDSDGLGLTGNAAVELPSTGGAMRNSAYGSGVSGDAVAAAAAAAGKHGADGPQLARAAMATSSAASSGNTARNGASIGGNVSSTSGGNGHVRMDNAGNSNAYNFSGKMDEGTFLAGNPKAGKSSFGGNRDLSVGKGRRPVSGEGSEIQQMYNTTKQVAGNQDRHNTAAMAAFLNDGSHGVGMGENGMTNMGGSAVSDDFNDPTKKLRRGFSQLKDDTDKKDEEQKKAQKTVMYMVAAMILSTAALSAAGYYLIKAGKIALKAAQALADNPLTAAEAPAAISAAMAKIIGGWICIGAGIAYAIAVLGVASHYYRIYGKDDGVGLGGIIASIVCMGALALAGALANKLGSQNELTASQKKVEKAGAAVLLGAGEKGWSNLQETIENDTTDAADQKTSDSADSKTS